MKLSKVMLRTLAEMAEDTNISGKSIAYPTFSTAKALHSRGLVQPAGMMGRFPAYSVTDKGIKVLADYAASRGQ